MKKIYRLKEQFEANSMNNVFLKLARKPSSPETSGLTKGGN